jgi:predicted DNA-binding transcriptional regulator AlpA
MSIDSLPAELARHRILNSSQSAAFINVSLPHFRRMYRNGSVPKPIQMGARKLGWRIGDLIDWLASRAAA